jgi:MGT family glycosyltransferase
MARILIATVPVVGHVTPLVPLCRALIARGHEVAWYTGRHHQKRVESAGARFFPYEAARDYDDAHIEDEYPERKKHEGMKKLMFDMKHVFIDPSIGQYEDLSRITKTYPADAIIADPAMIGASYFAEKTGIPAGVIGILPLVMSSVDTAPFGFGIQPMPGTLGRARNLALNAMVQKLVLGSVQKHWNATRARIGLPPTGWWMDHVTAMTFYLQPSIPSFEYPRSDLPETVRFIGMMPADRPPDVPAPDFWRELDGSRPVVHVTQGTLANTAPDLFAPALEGLAKENVLVVLSTGKRPVSALGLGALPKNARVAPFLSYPDFLPKTDVMVTNGGYGGVQIALSYGVPLVVAGTSEDKPEVAARVAWSGAGIDLKTARPKPEAVRAAVRKILDSPRYAARAKELAAEYGRHDSITSAVGAVEAVTSALRRPSGTP